MSGHSDAPCWDDMMDHKGLSTCTVYMLGPGKINSCHAHACCLHEFVEEPLGHEVNDVSNMRITYGWFCCRAVR